MGSAVGVISLVVVVAIVAFSAGRCTAPEGDSVATDDEVRETLVTATTWDPDAPPNLMLDSPELLIEALREQLEPPITVRGIGIYDTYAWADVQDSDQPNHLDSYSFRDGVLSPEPSPVAAGPLEDWEDDLFTLESVKPDVLRALAHFALDEFSHLENEQLNGVSIYMGSDGPVITVSVSDPIRGGSGSVRADLQGDIIDISE